MDGLKKETFRIATMKKKCILDLTKKVMRFGRSGKLSPKYVGSYKIREKVGHLSYRLALPPTLSRIHNIFHFSQLRKYVSDSSHILEDQPIEVKENLAVEEVPLRIVDRKDQVLRRRTIPYVKVQWTNHTLLEVTWELEEDMRNGYAYLFIKVRKFRGRNFL